MNQMGIQIIIQVEDRTTIQVVEILKMIAEDDTTEESSETGIVTTDVLNVRSGAGTSYSVVKPNN